MDRLCDLHTHSHYSDGTASPAQIIAGAVEQKLSAVALTDHNTAAGLSEFMDAAGPQAVEGIPGVEISTGYHGRELHIVGLFLRPSEFERIEDFVSVINRRKEESNRALIEKLNQAGYELSYDEIRERHQGNINRAVIAARMLEKGYIASVEEAFCGPLSSKNGYYIPPERVPAFEAVDFLRSIRAVPVLAHPWLNLEEGKLRQFLREAIPFGLAAMETHYSTYTAEKTKDAVRIATEFGLLESGGSDFHGNNKPDIRLGTGKGTLKVPYAFAESMMNTVDTAWRTGWKATSGACP